MSVETKCMEISDAVDGDVTASVLKTRECASYAGEKAALSKTSTVDTTATETGKKMKSSGTKDVEF